MTNVRVSCGTEAETVDPVTSDCLGRMTAVSVTPPPNATDSDGTPKPKVGSGVSRPSIVTVRGLQPVSPGKQGITIVNVGSPVGCGAEIVVLNTIDCGNA